MKIALIGSGSTLAKQLLCDRKHHAEFLCWGTQKSEDCQECFEFRLPETPPNHERLLECDMVIYTAAAGVQSNKKYSRSATYEVNFLEPMRLQQNLSRSGYQGVLVTFGTYFELGEAPKTGGVNELQLTNHNNRYPNDYCFAKNLLSRYFNYKIESDKIRHFHLILPNLYGATEPNHRLIPYLMKNCESNLPISLSHGLQCREYLHLSDVTRLIFSLPDLKQKGIFNLSYPPARTVRSIVEMVIEFFPDYDQNLLQFGTVAKRDESMSYLALNDEKARNLLGWNPTIDLKTGISQYFEKSRI